MATKLLKLIVQRTCPASMWMRPASSSRDSLKDPGFPSSHTSMMTFISVYFAWYLHIHRDWGSSGTAVVAVVPPLLMAGARIWDADHTLLQTIAGVIWGTA